MRRLSLWILRLIGWRMEGELPGPKCVLIGAPHTSNWDFPIAMLLFWSLEVDARWVGKHTIFRWPTGWLMRALGGIPLDRTNTENFVDQIVDRFNTYDRLVLAIAPEGTRKHTDYWRSGFYWIAHGAGVPIALAYADYSCKVGGIGPSLMPSGDIEADMDKIRAFYADKVGKHPEKLGSIRLRPDVKEPTATAGTPVA
jgi:1-acyl-sn-glycerol-3-phosphate acyltransferase